MNRRDTAVRLATTHMFLAAEAAGMPGERLTLVSAHANRIDRAADEDLAAVKQGIDTFAAEFNERIERLVATAERTGRICQAAEDVAQLGLRTRSGPPGTQR